MDPTSLYLDETIGRDVGLNDRCLRPEPHNAGGCGRGTIARLLSRRPRLHGTCDVDGRGAYLKVGPLWLCLSRDENARSSPHADYTHIAFSVTTENFAPLSERLMAECVIWKENVSEGGSTYFLDPDGHRLEIHVGSLETRLAHYRDNPSKGARVFDV